MAYPTAPTWNYDVPRHSLSNFDRYAAWVTSGKAGREQFAAEAAKMGGIDKYRQALVDYQKDYLKYEIDFAKADGKLQTLSDKYQKAIDSGLFSQSEVSQFQKQVKALEPRISEQKRQADLDAIAKEQRRARLEAAANISGPLLNQAVQESNALITKAQGERDTAKKQIEEQYQNDYKTINDLYSAGQITEEQRDFARDQAEANWTSAMQTVDANYTTAKNSINALYEQNASYISSLDADIRSGKASPTGKYTINTTPAGLKPVTASYSLASSAIPRVEDLPEQQPEVDPYAGMTIQERIDAKRSEAQARIDEAMSQPQPTVETRSVDDIFADILAERGPTRPMGEGPGGLTLDQSEEIAKVLTAFTGVGEVTDDEGKPYDNPIEQIANRIYNEGYQSVLDNMLEQGGVLPVSGNYIDRAVAEDFAKTILERNNYNLTNLNSWANTVQSVGFERAVELFKEKNRENYFSKPAVEQDDGGVSLPSGNIQTFIDRNNTAIQTLRDTAAERIDDAILRVNAGLPALPTIPEGMTTQEVLDQIYASSNFKLSPELQEDLVGYADKFGADTALAYLDLLVNPTNAPGRDVSVYDTVDELFSGDRGEPIIIDRGEPTLGTTGPTIPSTTELNVPVERGEVTPAAGLGTLTPAPTTSGIPMGGGIPGGGITTYQPAPYTPPPLISQAPARPTLTPLEQLIGTPDVTRPVGAPMQALTPQQAGSQFVPPTQEDYYAFFGYTPEQLNAEQYLAELEGAPRAGIGAQTVPVLPAAVTGAPAPTGMKEGGMPQDAQRLASKGRGGDSMLVHMAPEEIAGLQALALQNGTSLTINPETGLPEALSLKDILGPIVVIGGSILSGGAATPGLLSLAYGVGSAIGSGSIEKGIAAGLSAYGGANLISGGYTAVTDKVIPGFQLPPTGTEGVAVGKGGVATNTGGVSITAHPDLMGPLPDPTLLDSAIAKLSGPATVPTDLNSAYLKGALPLTTGMSLQEGIEQREAYDDYMAKVGVENEAERKRNRQLFESTLGSVPTQYARAGGLMSLAGGGVSYAEGGGTTGPTNEPRMVKGTGDGMSDSVPATIEGVQEARLANDEFVIPADVVADLGNGSSSAGAKQLYAMMDRVRKARHGTTEQPPEIDVMKLMPA